MFDENHIEKLLKGLIRKIADRPILNTDQQLWDESDIADYFKYSVLYTRKNILTNPYFPPSRDLPTSPNGERVSRRWKAKDVIDFAMAFDKKNVSYRSTPIRA